MPDARLSLEGRWQMVRAEFAGESAPEMVVKNTELELREGRYAVRFSGEAVDGGTYTLGETKEANTLILHGESGPNAGRTIPCIFQLVGTRLRVCYGVNGRVPATIHESKNVERDQYLAIYRRTPEIGVNTPLLEIE